MIVQILPAAQKGAYWIGSKFVFACNWKISKKRFTPKEQLEFEKYMIVNKISTH